MRKSTGISPDGRRQLLLVLLGALGGSENKLDFQKLLFLFCQELSHDPATPISAPYEFVPYKYGAFSFTSYADRRTLIRSDCLVDDDERWTLTQGGHRLADQMRNPSASSFASRHRHLRGDALVRLTYQQYPYYAIRSRIIGKILPDDPNAVRRIGAKQPETLGTTLLTIGYEGRTLDRYLNLLIRSSATLLCDVRRNAISRKYGFSKTTLSGACAGVGIRYEHLPELGIPSNRRNQLRYASDYVALFRAYEREILPRNRDALDRITAWLSSGESVALTCFERQASQCHRKCVANYLSRHYHRWCCPAGDRYSDSYKIARHVRDL